MRVLICGHRAPSAQGLGDRLLRLGWEVDYFSRGTSGRKENVVEGEVFSIDTNSDLHTSYDAVVNFIVLKDMTVDANIAYAKQLVRFCNMRSVKTLVHISSISAYPASPDHIDETTAIAEKGVVRGAYSTLKSEVDHALLEADKNFALALVRPGLILDPSLTPPRTGIVRRVVGRVNVLLGDDLATLPLVRREDVHLAIVRILGATDPSGVFLAVSRGGTKRDYAKNVLGLTPLLLPRGPALFGAKVLRRLGIFSDAQLRQVEGLFRRAAFDPSFTQRRLGMEFR